MSFPPYSVIPAKAGIQNFYPQITQISQIILNATAFGGVSRAATKFINLR